MGSQRNIPQTEHRKKTEISTVEIPKEPIYVSDSPQKDKVSNGADEMTKSQDRDHFLAIPPIKHNPPARTNPRHNATGTEGLSIASCNIEGVKSNTVYFQKLCKNYDIVCVQEHWLWDFQKHEMQSLSVNKDFHIRCYDSIEPLTGFRLPRGQGGVSILWPTHLSSKVKKLDDGNERIIGIELLGIDKMCIITSIYLQTTLQ